MPTAKPKRITVNSLQKLKQNGEKITCLTCYDASFASLLSHAGIEVLLVGDTLGMVIGGHDSTVPVSVADMAYHIACVRRANPLSLILGDMPFMSYCNTQQALANAAELVRAGAEVVKLEGGSWLKPIVAELSEKGIPVCVHLGLTPQSVHMLSGYRIQGREPEQAKIIKDTALELEAAGAKLLVLECVPYSLAQEISLALKIPVLGIGAGPYCDGQILVTPDMLGITQHAPYKFVHNFLLGQTGGIPAAIQEFVQHVKSASFPTLEQSFV